MKKGPNTHETPEVDAREGEDCAAGDLGSGEELSNDEKALLQLYCFWALRGFWIGDNLVVLPLEN